MKEIDEKHLGDYMDWYEAIALTLDEVIRRN